MKFKETPHAPLEGGLNVNVIVTDAKRNRYLKRYPKDNPHVLELLRHEHDALGFSQHGGTCRVRSPEEQRDFLERATELGLKVAPSPLMDEKGYLYYPFMEGAETLEDFLPHASDEETTTILHELFADLRKAHVNGIIYGDRWSPNMLVVPRLSVPGARPANTPKTFVHIDFDLEIGGPVAREFELAEATFYALCAGGEKARRVLTNILSIDTSTSHFNYEAFVEFLERFAHLFSKDNKKYGDREPDVAALITSLNTTRRKS